MRKKIIFVGIASFLVLTGIFFIFFKREDFQIFPTDEINPVFYNDQVDQGHSQILQQAMDRLVIRFQFSLDSGFFYPYCGVALKPADTKMWDFSEYDRCRITLKTDGLSSVFMYFHVFDLNVRDRKSRHAFRRLLHNIKVVPDSVQTVELIFKEFDTPTWWYSLIEQDKSDFGDPDLSQTESLHFTSGLDKNFRTSAGFEIYEISMTKNYTPIYMLLGGIWCLIMTGYSTYLIYNKQSEEKNKSNQEVIQKIEIAYKPVEPEPDRISGFIDYINSNFQNPNLTLSNVTENTGISDRTISGYIAEHYRCNFKTYINNIRINEAKRLLEEKGLSSGEVAYLVGFNSPTNFNRVFKTMEGCNPTEYIQSLQKA